VTGVVALANGGTAGSNAATARTGLGATTVGGNIFTLANPSAIRFLRLNADNTAAALSDSDFRTAIGLDTAATNPATAFQPSSSVLTNLAANNGSSLTNIPMAGVVGALATNGNGAGLTNLTAANITGTVGLASNVTGAIAISNGGSGATTAGGARTNLGLILPALTNTNVTNFRTAIELGATNSVTFNSVQFGNDTTNDVVTVVDKQGLFLESDQTNTGTAAINFQGDASSKMAANTRTNLGLGWSALTNSNAGTGLVSVNTNGEVVSPTNFWQVAPISTTVQYQTNVVSTSTNAATNSRNLFLYSLATSVSGITNTITLPTNPATTFEGDRATIIHGASTTNAVTAVRQLGAATNIITLNQYEEAVLFIYRSGAWGLADNISYVEPIYFSGTNAAANAAASRTNLGLGATSEPNFQSIELIEDTNSFTISAVAGVNRTNLGLGATWLTNTNVTNFRTAIGLGSANAVSFSTVAAQEIYDSVGNKVIDLENFILGVGTTAALEWATNQVQVNVPILFNGTNSASATRTNLSLGATWLTNTNVTNFRSAIGLGFSALTNSNLSNFKSATELQSFRSPDGYAALFWGDAEFLNVEDGINMSAPMGFIGPNAAAHASNSRANLGIPLPALTNTNNANFQAAVFATNAAPTNSANVNGIGFNTAVAWMEVTVSTNGTNHSFRIPLFR
jgi:hypothetical protein